MQAVGQVVSHNTMSTWGHKPWTTVFNMVNAVELDVWPALDWKVAHWFSDSGDSLKVYLDALVSYRKKVTAAHPLLIVFIEIHDNKGWNVADFQTIIRDRFDQNALFMPNHLRQWARAQPGASRTDSLRDLVHKVGWPTYGSQANKVMFVLNCGTNHNVLLSYLKEAPGLAWGQICFPMLEPTETYNNWDKLDEVVIFNEEYAKFPAAVRPDQKNCLRRAWKVDVGGEELKKNRSEASKAIKAKHINFLAYDEVENAFSTPL
jgi:hypothetical protein